VKTLHTELAKKAEVYETLLCELLIMEAHSPFLFRPRSHPYLGTQYDAKSLLINLFSTLLFLLPFACYLDQLNTKYYCGGVLISVILAILAPPLGWKRPHPYTDQHGNTPYPSKNK
jgi:hypothetical protein